MLAFQHMVNPGGSKQKPSVSPPSCKPAQGSNVTCEPAAKNLQKKPECLQTYSAVLCKPKLSGAAARGLSVSMCALVALQLAGAVGAPSGRRSSNLHSQQPHHTDPLGAPHCLLPQGRDAPAPGSGRSSTSQQPAAAERDATEQQALQPALAQAGAGNDTAGAMAEMQSQLQAVQSERDAARQQAGMLSSNVKLLEGQLEESMRQLARAQQQLHTSEEQLAASNSNHDALMAQIQRLEEETLQVIEAQQLHQAAAPRTSVASAGDDEGTGDGRSVARSLATASAAPSAEPSSAVLQEQLENAQQRAAALISEKEATALLLMKLGEEQEVLSEQLRQLEADKAEVDVNCAALTARNQQLEADLEVRQGVARPGGV